MINLSQMLKKVYSYNRQVYRDNLSKRQQPPLQDNTPQPSPMITSADTAFYRDNDSTLSASSVPSPKSDSGISSPDYADVGKTLSIPLAAERSIYPLADSRYFNSPVPPASLNISSAFSKNEIPSGGGYSFDNSTPQKQDNPAQDTAINQDNIPKSSPYLLPESNNMDSYRKEETLEEVSYMLESLSLRYIKPLT